VQLEDMEELCIKSKTQKQLESYEGEKYIVADNIEIGFGNKVPLWMFGFLY
jgi:hypothetical protein